MIDATTPYDPVPTKSPRQPAGIEYMRSFHYIFENPKWIANVLFLGLCALSAGIIPIIGQLVVQGYQFSVIEALHLRPGCQYPDFDMNKLLDYMLRGLWVFLVTLVLGLAMLPVLAGLGILSALLVSAATAAAGEDGTAIAIMILVPLLSIVFLAVCLVISIFLVPFMLRAGLTQDFGAAFDFGFAKQFVRNTWKELILCALFSMAAGMILAAVGLVMFCVGVYATMSIVGLMHAHLMFQLYRLHLARGGDAIPIPVTLPPQQFVGR